jgi:hypothetical protein
MRQIIMPFMATTVLTFIAVGTAQAIESCTDLKTQLVAAEAKDAGSKKIKRYTDAIKKQTKMIAKLDADLTRYNCEGGSNAACKQLNSTKKKMSSNLGKLTKKRDSLSKGAGNKSNGRRSWQWGQTHWQKRRQKAPFSRDCTTKLIAQCGKLPHHVRSLVRRIFLSNFIKHLFKFV